MKSFVAGILAVLASTNLCAAQSAVIDLSAPMNGPSKFVFDTDGKPVERGAAVAKAEPKPAAQSADANSGGAAMRPAYRPADAQNAQADCKDAAEPEKCASGTRRIPVIVAVGHGGSAWQGAKASTTANQPAATAKPAASPAKTAAAKKPATRIRFGRRR